MATTDANIPNEKREIIPVATIGAPQQTAPIVPSVTSDFGSLEVSIFVAEVPGLPSREKRVSSIR